MQKLNNKKGLLLFLALVALFFTAAFLVNYTNIGDFFASVVSKRGEGVLPVRVGSSKGLPSGDLTTEFIPSIIKIILSFVGIAITVMLIYAGSLFAAHYGNEDLLTKAKHILGWAILGIIVIVFSYALIWGITHLEWNRGG